LTTYPISVVCMPVGKLCKNGWLDLDVILGGEWSRSRDTCVKWGGDHWREGAILLTLYFDLDVAGLLTGLGTSMIVWSEDLTDFCA